ncbi:MAG: GGDEF domain-containing protein [Butyrivibrio sp.]|nr:GGDEF domain-containing protein [Butyrivibrio sp.]
MKEFNPLKLVISDNGHIIISSDAPFSKMLMSGVFDSFDDYIHEDYIKIYRDNLALADNSWFPVRILSGDGSNLFCARAKRKKSDNTSTIHMEFAKVEELFESQSYLTEAVNLFKTQVELYDDVFFNYDPKAKTVTLANTQIASFDAGIYSIDDIEDMLCRRTSPDQEESLKGFIGQVRAKAGRFSTRIESNLLNDDPSIVATILEASYVFLPSGQEHVVGHMHLEHRRAQSFSSTLKRDSLTGLLEKSEIIKIARERTDDRHLEGTTLAITDIDFFKNINDTYGHKFGDVVIKRIADIIASEMGNSGVAGRFGGDEFLLVFYNIKEEEELRNHFRSIKQKIKDALPDLGLDESSKLSLSIGAASYSKDAGNYDDLFMLADHCLYIAKEKGRNRYIIYRSDKHGSVEEIQQQEVNKKILDSRGGISYGDVIVNMFNLVLHGEDATVEGLMDDFAQSFDLQRVSLIVGTPFTHRYTTGREKPEGKAAPDILLGMLNSEVKEKYLAGRDFVVVNRLDALPPQAEGAKNFLKRLGVLSYILLRFNDRDGNECFMIISSLGQAVQWNELHFKYYKAFIDLLSCFSLKE